MAATDNRIKVMQIIARMNVGGPAVIVADLMRGLPATEFDQVLITGFCDESEADYLEEVATDISAIRIAGLGRSVSPIADLKALFSLVATIKRIRPDVIHTHTAKAGVLGRLATMAAGSDALRVHTFHGHLLHGYFSNPKTQLVIAIEKFLARHTNILIAVGRQVREDLLAAGIGKAAQYRVFFPGLAQPKTAEKSELRANLKLDQSAIYCAFVGRMTAIKRPDRLLDIAAQMKERGGGIHFLAAGEGELFNESKSRAELEELPITFLGWRRDISELFAACDIAILTSDNEGIPLTLIQAAQAGLAIIAPAVGSISDIVVNEQTGFLTSPNPGAMASALSALVNDGALRRKLGDAGRSRAAEFFSLSRELLDHTEIYKRSLS